VLRLLEVPPELLAINMKDWVEAIIASACFACFVVFCSFIILWAYP
jgi:hypothetical protein